MHRTPDDPRLTVRPQNKHGLPCSAGTTGVVSSEVDDHGIWDALTNTQNDQTVDIIYANTSRAEVKLQPDRPIGYFQVLDPAEGTPLNDSTIAEIFDNPAAEPDEPHKGAASPPSADELQFLNESLDIQAPAPWDSAYRELLLNYHDVVSKGKFDLGFTDVIEHKIEMQDDHPVYIHQFRIPLEPRQTI